MKTIHAVLLAGLALGALPAVAESPEVRVALPEQHELVELQPGLQVIPEFDLEVFFTGNAYWLRGDDGWYVARRPAAVTIFTLAEPRSVPAALSRLPAGAHLDYHAAPGQRRSTKLLAAMAPPEREGEPEVAPPKPEPTPAPAAKKAPAAKAAKPVAKPATKPAAKPAAKPAVKKPGAKPDPAADPSASPQRR
jgi:hypothetical protein